MTDTTSPRQIGQRWYHVFSVQDTLSFFTYRQPAEWLVYLLDLAGLRHQFVVTEPDAGKVGVVGTAEVLTFVCAALNQQAEQGPGDPTPPAEAERLEATLDGPPLLTCHACGSPSIKLDTDVTTRVAIMFGLCPVVHVDRCGGHFQVQGGGSAECMECGAAVPDADMEALNMAAQVLAGADGTEWRILTDYRQF